MDKESVQSARSNKSERGFSNTQRQQVFNGPINDCLHMVHPNSSNIMFTPESGRINNDMHGKVNTLGPSPIYHPQGLTTQHVNYVPNWNHSQPQFNSSYLPYAQPGMYPPPQCMAMMGWSGPPVVNECLPSNGYMMQPIPPAPNQPFQHDQKNQPTLSIEQANIQNTEISNLHTPVSSQRNANQQIDQYCASGHDETAWVENATAVTGATSETGLSADNMSRYGGRYGLLASLALTNGPNPCVGGAAAALIRTEIDNFQTSTCTRFVSLLIYFCLGFFSTVSPIFMVIFPYLPSIGWITDSCDPTCEGNIIGMAVKLTLLILGIWILTTLHRPVLHGNSLVLPQVRLWRSLFLCLIFVVLFAFWLFYSVRILQPKEKAYGSIVLFACSLSDALLFVNYAGIALLEFQRIRSQYSVHVVRSPDGISKTYRISDMPLQKAALEILQIYMVDFTAYTQPLSSSLNSRRGKRCTNGGEISNGAPGNEGGSKYKFYDVDSRGIGGNGNTAGDKLTGGQATEQHLGPSSSARLYDEMETEKRVRKRRMRLLLAVEDAFAHANRMAKESGNHIERNSIGRESIPRSPYTNGRLSRDSGGQSGGKRFDPYEAAQTVFPTLIRPLQKYMRATRQQSRHPVDSVIDHLALCFTYGLSPLAFLERFNLTTSTPQQDAATAANALTVARSISQRHRRPLTIAGSNDADGPYKPPQMVAPGGQQVWQIVADRALSRNITEGVVFQLKRQQGNCEISLLCTVHRLPLLQLIEATFENLQNTCSIDPYASSHSRVIT